MKRFMMAGGIACAMFVGAVAFTPTQAHAGVYVRAPGVNVGVGIGPRIYRPYRYAPRPYYRVRPYYAPRRYKRRWRRRARRAYYW